MKKINWPSHISWLCNDIRVAHPLFMIECENNRIRIEGMVLFRLININLLVHDQILTTNSI